MEWLEETFRIKMKAVLEGTCHICGNHIPIGEDIEKNPHLMWVHAKCKDVLRCQFCNNLVYLDHHNEPIPEGEGCCPKCNEVVL